MMEHLRRLFSSISKSKLGSSGELPVDQSEPEPVRLPPRLQDQKDEQERLSLRLLAEAQEMHLNAAAIRKALGREVAIKLQRRA